MAVRPYTDYAPNQDIVIVRKDGKKADGIFHGWNATTEKARVSYADEPEKIIGVTLERIQGRRGRPKGSTNAPKATAPVAAAPKANTTAPKAENKNKAKLENSTANVSMLDIEEIDSILNGLAKMAEVVGDIQGAMEQLHGRLAEHKQALEISNRPAVEESDEEVEEAAPVAAKGKVGFLSGLKSGKPMSKVAEDEEEAD